jgi:hypothetical protein
MAEPESEQERPCLHCTMVDLIDDFFAEQASSETYPINIADVGSRFRLRALTRRVAYHSG